MHVNQQFRLRYAPSKVEVFTVTEIHSDDCTQMITFKCEDGSTGELNIHAFRDLYVPYGVEKESFD